MFKSDDVDQPTPSNVIPIAPLWRAPIHVGHSAEQRVRQLGIPGIDSLASGLLTGASGYRAASGPLYPAAYAGDRMWGESHADISRLLASHGWRAERVTGVDLIWQPERNIALIVTAGEVGTGYASYPNPQARYPREKAIRRLVNEKPPSLFGDVQTQGPEVWFVMQYVTTTSLRGELSRPARIGSKGSVAGWVERIIIPTDETDDGAPDETPQRIEPEIEIQVRRRSS